MKQPKIRGLFKDVDPAVRFKKNKYLVLITTFLAYACFHAIRKPFSIAKSPLKNPITGFSPFNEKSGGTLLGMLDTVFLVSYAFFMFVLSSICERSNLRLLIPVALLGASIGLMMWCLSYSFEIHNIGWFIIANITSGFFGSIGWPSVVAVLGHWVKGSSRSITLGIWNINTYFGNMVGGALGSISEEQGNPWPYIFFYPTFLAFVVSLFVAAVLRPHPQDCDFDIVEDGAGNVIVNSISHKKLLASHQAAMSTVNTSYVNNTDDLDNDNYDEDEYIPDSTVTFTQALLIPGVIEYSISLLFCKLISYTFLFWLPYYITSAGFDTSVAGYMSLYFDLGGILGSILSGYLNDRYGTPGTQSTLLMMASIPLLFLYYSMTAQYGADLDLGVHIATLILLGICITGPYSLITTAVSIDLGSHPKLGSSSALATVSAIIDGAGSVGACGSGIFISLIASQGWGAVFGFLQIACFLSALSLIRIVSGETGYCTTLTSCFGYILSCVLPQSMLDEYITTSYHNNQSDINATNGSVTVRSRNATLQPPQTRQQQFNECIGTGLDDLNQQQNSTHYDHANNINNHSTSSSHKDHNKRYKKENKMLAKELKKNRQLTQINEKNGGGSDDYLDVDQIYKQSGKY